MLVLDPHIYRVVHGHHHSKVNTWEDVATLATEALGSGKVQAFYLYDRTNGLPSSRNAQLLADRLRINLTVYDIDPEMRKERIYHPFIMRMILGSEMIAHRRSRGIFGDENPFVYTLRKGDLNGNAVKEFVYRGLVEPVERAFSARHIYRRKFLEEIALEKNPNCPA